MDRTATNMNLPEEEPGGPAAALDVRTQTKTYKNFFQNINDLSKVISFSPQEKKKLEDAAEVYHLRVPFYYFSLIKNRHDSKDPIRAQCIPSPEELEVSEKEFMDPLAEEQMSPVNCLVHRYPDRVLLIVTSQCFMYCRHCTRKRLWQEDIPEPNLQDIDKAISYIKKNKQIREVIVSGGDPLTLDTSKIDYVLSGISCLKNVEAIRIGTRAPVVFPQRINEALCRVLRKYNKLWINVQFNHPWEVTPQSAQACMRLARCGIPISNQSVLLRGINDNPEVMIELCHKLQSIRVRPYYLFQCDPVVGASHFRTPIRRGMEIIEKMRGFTSGMCVPTFVVDGIEGKGKVPLGPNYLVSEDGGCVTLRNYQGETFRYYAPKE
ncbi:MAG: KamA family radical SAM protein [Candidatus Omnitrophica bacterium]|nr:KamA family radical SAM protein [Candidatus Omnitrophota bacterium]MDD5429507.1 KamA family radical SAM protein [Candidatus Omnitrophota bacterium]